MKKLLETVSKTHKRLKERVFIGHETGQNVQIKCEKRPIKKRSFNLLCVLDLFSERWQSTLFLMSLETVQFCLGFIREHFVR